MNADPPVLWLTRTSIFCEKAAWALAYKQVPYREQELSPVTHSLVLRLRGRGATVPALDLAGHRISGSAQINQVLERSCPEPALYPGDAATRAAIVEVEAEFDALGHEVRRVVVDSVLEEPGLLGETFLGWRPDYERRLTQALHPVTASMTRAKYRINSGSVQRAHAAVLEAVGVVETRLRPSGYLITDSFTAADLTAAAMLAPLLMPAEYPFAAWRSGRWPDSLLRLRDELAAHAGGQWVLETYRRHRLVSTALSRCEASA